MTDGMPISGRIFISYRREETAYPAGWLYDRLTDQFGGQVFKDVDSIQLGDDFVEVITRAVSSCDVLLALIGDEWLSVTDATGMRRLDDPEDFVRLEIEAALTRRVRVIPILVDGASMPRPEQLPKGLAGLGRRQALELSPSRFEFDTSRLLRVLEWTLAEVRTGERATEQPVPATGPTQQHAPTTPEAEDHEVPPAAIGATTGTAPGASQPAPAPAPAPAAAAAAGRSTVAVPRRWLLVGGGIAGLLVLVLVAVVAFQQGARSQIDVGPAVAATSPDGLRVTDRAASAQHDPPQVGDSITVNFTLRNTTSQPIDLSGGTFVAARGPSNDNRDTEPTNVGTVVAPGNSVQTERTLDITSAGRWQFWPCYESTAGLCPDRWTAFSVDVS